MNGSICTSVLLTYDVPEFCQYSSFTSNPNVHHSAIDYLVLSLQCGQATAGFVSSRHRDFGDFVAEMSNGGSGSLNLLFLEPWASVFTAPPSMSSTRTYEYFLENLLRFNVVF